MKESRIILSKNGVLSDLSVELNDFKSGTSVIDIEAATDYLYIGSFFPFNHKYFMVTTANDQDSAIEEIAVWDGQQWRVVTDILDETSVGGKSLAQSGIISWVPDREHGWLRSDTVRQGTPIEGLEDILIYDMYWARLKWSDDLKDTTALKYIGQRFSTDSDLILEYPDLTRTDVKTNFTAGKTTWDDQHLLAAERIVDDMKSQQIVISKDQILTPELFRSASVHKVASIIFNAFGKPFEDQKRAADQDYKKAMNKNYFDVDWNIDGRLDPIEKANNQGFMSR